MRTLIISIFIFISCRPLLSQTEEVIIHIDKNSIPQDSTPIFFIVEEMPVFSYNNCDDTKDCFLKYIADSIRFPSVDCFGKVYIQFVVEPDSSTSNVQILRGLENCQGYEREVIRIIESMPKWIPGRQRGKAVRVMKTMPIIFDPNE